MFVSVENCELLLINGYIFEHCVTFSGKKITVPPSPNVPVRLCFCVSLFAYSE